MNEEALNDAYALFSSKGYNGGIKEFKSLIGSNPDALKDSYILFRSSGYNGDINQYSELVGLKKKELSDFTTPKVAMESPTGAGSLGPVETQPKKKVTITTPNGTPAVVEWGPTKFKSSDEAPVPDMRLSDIFGNVDATIDGATKNKIATAIGVTGGVFSKIIGLNPNKTTGEAILDTKRFIENTATAYNVGALGAQIQNNLSDDVPDLERVAALKKKQNEESKKLLSTQMKGQGVGDFFDIMSTNPATYLTEILTTSATQLAGGLGSLQAEEVPLVVGLGALTGGVGARGYLAGRNSLAAEMSSRTIDKLEENGVNTTDPKQLRAAFENKELMGTIAKEIEAPSGIVAALDIVSAMVAGGLGTPVKEIAAQMFAGSAGEAGAQIAEYGRITAPAAILTEAIAELPGGLVEIGFAAKTKDIARKAQVNRDIKDIEAQIESTKDIQTKDILLPELNKLRGEKNQIFKDYVDFANSLPEEQVAQLNELNQEVVKLTNAIESVTVDSVKESLSQQRNAAIAKIVELESQVTPKTDAIQEQTAGEIPVQPGATVGEEVAQGEPQAGPQVAAEEVVTPEEEVNVRTIAKRQAEAESKIKRKDLFTGVGDFSTKEGGSDKAAVPVSHSENNGIEIVEYAHPETGSVDVIVTGKSDNNFVGFYRLYENGKPTNRWSSKFENQSRNKEDFKTMISRVQALLPEGHEYTEKTSISTDGLRVWNQQLSRGYELQYDENGNVITNRVYVNGDAIVNELGVNVEKGKFEPARVTEQDFEKVKEVLAPYLEKLGLSSENVYFESTNGKFPPWDFIGRIAIDLPILKKADLRAATEEEVAPVVEDITFGTAFNLQDKTAERTVSDKNAWGGSGLIRERIENAGDILRELSSRGDRPDPGYIQEKIDKLRSWIPDNASVRSNAIPSDIKTIDDFNKTNLRFSNVTDGFEYLMKFNSDVVNKIRSEYEAIPTYTKEQKLAKDSVLALLNQDITGLEKNLDSLQDVVNTIKREGKLEIVKEKVAPVTIESTVFAAPFYDTKVNNIEEARAIRQSEPYVRNMESIRLSAPLFNVEIDGVDESIGGFVNEAGDKIVEVSNIIRVKGTPEDVQNYAAFLATSSPETQEATIAATYVEPDSETHNIDELTISVSDVDGAIEALKENDIYDFTINDSKNTITFLDFSKGAEGDFMDKVGTFVESLEQKNINYERRKIRAIDSKYIGPREREGIFSRIQETLVQQGQTGTELYRQVEQAIARNQEFLTKTAAVVEEVSPATQELTEQDLPGFDRMMTELDGVVKKSEQRGASRAKVFENAKNYIVGSKAYEVATDVQRESLVRMVNKMFGKREKSAPSVGRLFDTVKDIKKITMAESELLKNQIRRAARGAREAKTAIANASKQVSDSLKELITKGQITVKQSSALVRRFARVNPLDDISVGRFIDYATKVFQNAEYDDIVRGLERNSKIAKKNAQTKLGIAKDLVQPLLRIFSIKPDAIPDSVFETYRELVDIMSKRKAVLELPDIQVLREKAQLVTDAVQLELSMVPFLADVFNAYAEKVLTKDGKLDYAATVNKMVKEEIITIEDGQILRDFRSSVLPIVEKAKRSEGEIQKERALLLDYISESSIKANELPSRDERELAQELADLIKTDAVESLGKVVTEDGKIKYNDELNKLALIIDNINNGFLPHYAQLLVERLTAINKLKILDKTIPLAKPLRFSKFEGKVKSLLVPEAGKPLTEMLRFGPAFYLDQSFGIFKGKPLYDSVFGETAERSERYKSLSEQIQNRLKAAEEAVFKSNNYDFNESVMSKFKMMTYLRELEFLSNQGSKQVNPATAFIKATIQHIKGRNAIYSDSDKDKLENILENYTEDGAVKMKKLYDSFNSAEKKAIEEIQSINAELRDKALFTSVVIRGDKIELLDDYMPLNVMYVHRPQDALIGDAFINSFNESINASTRAKSLISRTGEVNAINFDVFSSTSRAANYVLTDYYMTKPIRTARRTIALAEKSLNEQGNPQEQQDVLNAVKTVFEESVLGFLGNSFSNSDIANDAVKFVTRQGYRTTLAGTGKFMVELISNISSAVLFDPAALNIGMKLRDVVFSSIGPKVMGALKAKQQSRLYPNDTLSGRLIDPSIMNQAAGAKGSRSKSDIANRMQQIYNSFFVRKYVNSVALLADSLISTPDKMVTRPFWFGAFTNEFEKLTGKKPDFDLIADNDEQYMNENKSALDKATNLADEKAVFIGSTNNSFMGILAGRQKKGKGGLGEAAINLLSAFNNYMLSFIKYDFFAARTAIYAMRRQGTLTPRQGAALLAAVTVRQTIYSVLLPMAAALIISTVYRIAAAVRGEEYEEPEDEDEKSFAQRTLQSIISTVTSFLIGRDFGNIVKAPIAYGVERINQEYLDFLRNGEYDAYEDQIMFSQIPADERSKNGRSLQDLNYVIFGPTAPFLRTLDKAVKVYTAPPKKEKAAIDRANMEKTVRMPFEFIGLMGGIPFYKDAKSVLFNSMYKDLEKAEKTAGGVSKMGKQDMERLYPDVYNQLYGPGGSMIDYEQLKKEIRKEKELVRKAAKD